LTPRLEETLKGSQDRLDILMERIITSEYISIEELVWDCDSYSIDEIRAFLDRVVERWKANELAPAAMYGLLKFLYLYLSRPELEISLKNRVPMLHGSA